MLLVGLLVIGSSLASMGAPAWAALSTIVICAAVFGGPEDSSRDLARIQCELSGHWTAEFKTKYGAEARCPRCKEIVRVRAPGSDGPGMQSCEDTLHQRIYRLEKALHVEEQNY
jgi:hypothetical protein